MASIRISQLASVSSVDANDFLIVNDNDTNTRKISYSDFSLGLIKSAEVSQTLTGSLTITSGLSTGALNVDNDTLVVDDTTDRVGIGLTGPAFALDVEGDIQVRAGNTLRMADSTTSYAVTLQAPGTLAANSAYTLPITLPSLNGMALVSTTAGAMDWAPILSSPLSSAGQMIVQNGANVTAALSPGSANQVLTIDANTGIPGWAASQSGFSDPMTAAGQMIIRDQSNVTSALSAGTIGQVLKVGSTGVPEWGLGSAAAAGSQGQIQFNNAGALGASGNLDFDTGSLTLGVNNVTIANELSTNSVSSNLVPSVTALKTLGDQSNRWNALFLTAGLNFLSPDGTRTGQVTYGNGGGYNFGGSSVGGGLSAGLNIFNGASTNYIGITVPNNINGSYVLTLPPTAGASGSILTTTGSGALNWTDSASGTISINTVNAATIFSSGELDVGSDTDLPNFRVQANGQVNIGATPKIELHPDGSIHLNESPGSAGQVLTSAGAGAQATWTTVSGGGGTKGQKGDTGDTGQKGQTGSDGTAGSTGTKGSKGEPGTNGAKGQTGAAQKGQKGIDGTAGTKGQKGEVGIGEKGQKGIKGEGSGVFTFKGNVAEVGDLPAAGNTNGDVYRVTNGGQLYVWDGTQWVQMGLGAVVKGEKGDNGATGDKGQKGQDGTQGTAGTNGDKGQKGLGGVGQKGEPGVNGSNGTKGQKGTTGTGTKGQKGGAGVATAGGANTQVQYNDNGTLGGSSNFIYNPTVGATVNGLTCNGSMTIGADSTDSVNIQADVLSNIIPSSDNLYSLGSSAARWKELFVSTDIRFASAINTSQKIQKPFTQTSARGLAIGDIEIHSGVAGTGSTWIGKGQGGNAGGASADHQTIIGFQAGMRSPGADNTLIGYMAGRNLEEVSGSRQSNDNVLIGSDLADSSFMLDCFKTIQIGNGIAQNFQNISNCVFIGHEEMGANFKNGQGSTVVNYFGGITNPVTVNGSVLIGGALSNGTYNPVHSASTLTDVVAIGSASITNAYVKVDWTIVSDSRDKLVQGGVPHGLDFISKLSPKSFYFTETRGDETPHGSLRYGFLAQDIMALEGPDPVIVDDGDPDHLKMTNSELIPVLVNAIQELKIEVEKLKAA
jgi:hypothetical protein